MQDKPTSGPSILSALSGLVEQMTKQNELLATLVQQNMEMLDILMQEAPEDEGMGFHSLGQRQ